MNGQQRRAWLDDLIARYVVPAIPPEMRGQVAAVNAAMNPVQAIGDSMAAGRQMGATGLSMPQRVEAAGNMLSGVAGVVAPAVAASRVGGQAANALAEGLAGMTAPQRNALADFGADEFGGITLWHGSPHDFDRFDMSQIGTGEGSQAYGHGLYFAENEGVAKAYRDTLAGANRAFTLEGQPFDPASLTGIEKFAFETAANNPGKTAQQLDDLLFDSGLPDAALESVKPFLAKYASRAGMYEAPKGRLYQVDVAADPADFLDWDKPLSEQPAKVREAVAPLGYDNSVRDMWEPVPDAEYRAILRAKYGVDSILDVPRDKWSEAQNLALRPVRAKNDLTGQRIVEDLAGGDANYSEEATARLREAGIPGIRYLDAGSRGAGDGSRNYVVFDDKLITILKKYGALPAAFGGALVANPDQAQAGGVTLTGQPPEPGYLSFGQIAGAPMVASGPVGPLAALSHGTNALARFLHDQMPGQPGPITPPAPVQKPDGSWGW